MSLDQSVGAGTVTDADVAVRTQGLTKRFGHQVAVDHIDMAVPTGSVYGFLGPNGSGKTTTIRMLLRLITPTSGNVDRLNLAKVGSLVEGPAFHPYLTGRANLARLDACDPASDGRTARTRINAALERVGLLAAAGKKYRAYSLGMRQRLAIASALLQPRDLLVLDEPTNGLDPQGTREVRHLVTSLATDGATILISSHLLSEVDQVCTHVGVMSVGRLVAQESLTALRASAAPRVRLITPDPSDAAGVLTRLGLTEIDINAGSVAATPGKAAPETVVAALVSAGVRVREFALDRPSLEDVFVKLTGEGFNVSG